MKTKMSSDVQLKLLYFGEKLKNSSLTVRSRTEDAVNKYLTI